MGIINMQLRIDKLTFKNYKSITDEFVEFDSGINILSGDNGQGKTTIIEAISMLYYNHYQGKLNDYINRDAKTFYISSEGVLDNKSIVVSMSYDGKTSTKILIHDELELHGSEANKYLDELLNQNLSVIGTIFSADTPTLISTTPSNSREHLKEIYDINFKEKISEYDKVAKKLDKEDKKLLEQKLYHLMHKTYELQEIKELPFTSIQYEKYKQEVKDLTQELSGIGLYKEKLNNLKYNISQHSNQISSWETEIGVNRNNIISANSEIISIKEDTTIDKLQQELEAYRQRLLNIKVVRIKKLDDTIITDLQNKRSDLNAEYQVLDKRKKDIEHGICPTCNRACDSHYQEDLSKQMVDKLDEFENVRRSLQQALENKKEVEGKIKLNDQAKQEKELLSIKIQNQEVSIKEKKINKEIKISELSSKVIEYKNSIVELEKAINLSEEQLIDFKEQLEDVNKLSESSINESNINTLISEKEALVRQYEAVINTNNQSIEFNKKKELEEVQDKKELKNIQKKLDNLQKKINNYLEAIQILKKDFPAYIISDMVNSIEYKMNDIIEKVYREGFSVNIVENKSGIHVLYKNGLDVRRSSGWEKELYSACYSLALNNLIGHSLVIMDEPDSAASKGNSYKFFEYLLDYLNNEENKQVIIISHKESIREMIENNNGVTFLVDEGKVRRI